MSFPTESVLQNFPEMKLQKIILSGHPTPASAQEKAPEQNGVLLHEKE